MRGKAILGKATKLNSEKFLARGYAVFTNDFELKQVKKNISNRKTRKKKIKKVNFTFNHTTCSL